MSWTDDYRMSNRGNEERYEERQRKIRQYLEQSAEITKERTRLRLLSSQLCVVTAKGVEMTSLSPDLQAIDDRYKEILRLTQLNIFGQELKGVEP